MSFAYFALVMATGIVSIASSLLGLATFAWLLFYINIVAFLLLWCLLFYRLFRRPAGFLDDAATHERGAGLLTTVAATCTLGSQFVILAGLGKAGLLLWLLGFLLWIVLLYFFLSAVITRPVKPGLETGIHGGWLVIVVSTQSVSILGTLVADQAGGQAPLVRFLALGLFLAGCMLYMILITLIFYRLVFFHLEPEEFTPPYWINMGATAITTLSGATLIQAAGQFAILERLLPFLQGITLLFWATGSFWIPLLIVLEVWRHLVRRYPVRYTLFYWDIVFPLGMYTTCTFQLSRVFNISLLDSIVRVFLYIAIGAWILTAIGLANHLRLTWLAGRSRPTHGQTQ